MHKLFISVLLSSPVLKHCLKFSASGLNCSSDLKMFANSRSSASKGIRLLEQFFITVGQNNFGNKIPFLNNVPALKNWENKSVHQLLA